MRRLPCPKCGAICKVVYETETNYFIKCEKKHTFRMRNQIPKKGSEIKFKRNIVFMVAKQDDKEKLRELKKGVLQESPSYTVSRYFM